MSYIGSTPTTQSFVAGTDYFNGTGSQVAFTLSRSVNSVNDIEVIVNNVEQIPSGYLVSGTTLTFSAAPSSGTSNVYVRYLSTTNLSLAIPAGTSASFNTVTATTLAATNLSYTGTLTGGTGVVNIGSGQVYKDASGNVGIGTSSMTRFFNLYDTTTNAQTAYFKSTQASGGAGFVAYNNGGEAATFQINGSSNTSYAGANSVNIGSITNNVVGFITNNTERARIDSSGNLLVGTTSALAQAGRATFVGTGNGLVTQVANGQTAYQSTNTSGTSAYYAAIWGNNGNSFSTCGTIQVSGSNTSYNTSSDYRLKEDVQPMTGALAKVARLKPVTYKWKSDGTDSEGFIAHELAEICPHAVSGEKDALKEDGSIMPQGIDTSFLVATLAAAIQEQQTLV